MENWVEAIGLALFTVAIGYGLSRTVLPYLWALGRRGAEPLEPDELAPATAAKNWLPVYVVINVALVGVSVLAFLTALNSQDEADEIENFPTAAGEIIDSRAVANVLDTDMSMVGDVVETKYNVFIAYRYNVGGIAYTGNRITFDERLSGEERLFEKADADELLERYPAGAAVKVTYDPDDPARAGLEVDRAEPVLGIGLMAGALLALVAGALFVPLMWRAFSSPPGDK